MVKTECLEMPQHIRSLSRPPSSFEELKQAIVSRQVIFPLRVENVAKRVLAEPELMAFGSTPSIAKDCGVSPSTVIRFVMHLGFQDVARARVIFQNELRRRLSVRSPSELDKLSSPLPL
jgi:DNA-binding MurR/RpiR family transcriptional regulator